MINSGRMRRKIKIQKETVTRGTYGEEIPSWSDWSSSVWAQVEPISMNEIFNIEQYQSEITHRMTIRYRSGVEPKMRAIYRNETFNIESILDNEQKNHELVLLVSRVNT